jgi:DtxR family Mn-dependent transcriptional regulator
MESTRVEEYLEAIYKQQNVKSPVSTSSLAEDLKVSAPAVTDMLRQLKEQGLIEYKPGKGSTLTAVGQNKALRVIRRHRLWERFLTDILGMKWDRVHDEACKLEHINSPQIEEGISSLLGNAHSCPHGHSIPDKDGRMEHRELIPLKAFKPQQRACIEAVAREDSELLQKIERLGLQLRDIIIIQKKNPDGSMEAQHGHGSMHVSAELANVILARPVSQKETTPTEERLPLSKLLPGQSAILSAYRGGRGMLGRCLSLGFTPGSEVKMLENHRGGPVLVRIHDTSVALGRGLADKITVLRRQESC